MYFIDVNCSIGMRSIMTKGSFYDIKNLIKRMTTCGIAEAMVYHAMAEEYHPKAGNERLISVIKDYYNLHPVCVVMPNATEEFLTPKLMIEFMKTNCVKLVRAFPDKHNYILSTRYSSELLEVLNEYKIPLMIGMDQLDCNNIYEIALHYKKLPLILTNVGYRADRYIYPLLEKTENIYIETSSYKVNFGIESLCRRFGSNRLIFGSGAPIYSIGSAVTMITHLDISDKDKEAIAGNNLKHLLGDVIL